jgi:antitoxin HigA-1
MAKKNVVRVAPMVHPGEILREEFMKPMGLSINQVARDLYVPVTRVSEIVNERRGVSAETAIRLGRYFGTSPELWLNLQSNFDLQKALRSVGPAIESRVQPHTLAAAS